MISSKKNLPVDGLNAVISNISSASAPSLPTLQQADKASKLDDDNNNSIGNHHFDKPQSQPLNLKINYLNSEDRSIAVGQPINDRKISESNKHKTSDKNVTIASEACSNYTNLSDNNRWLVKQATNWQLNLEENYKMSSELRGLCLIVNNVEFEMDVLPKRKGSDMDAYRFKKIFQQLGFQIESKRNLTAEKMKTVFKQTSVRCLAKHDALIVILLSHGTESGIYGCDGLEVDLNDILANFDNKRCKQLIGKPKVFIVQACRGRLADYGVKELSQQFFSQPETQLNSTQSMRSTLSSSNLIDTPKITRWSETDKNNHPTRTDMVLCFSCHTGYVSTRNEDKGSWLGESLARNLQLGAWQKHLIEILNMVSREIRRKKSSDGHKQVLEITSIGFDRNLYFNPGLKAEEK